MIEILVWIVIVSALLVIYMTIGMFVTAPVFRYFMPKWATAQNPGFDTGRRNIRPNGDQTAALAGAATLWPLTLLTVVFWMATKNIILLPWRLFLRTWLKQEKVD